MSSETGLTLLCRGYKVLRAAPSFLLKHIYAHEFDFAGVVADANGTDFKEGDAVFGSNSVCEFSYPPSSCTFP